MNLPNVTKSQYEGADKEWEIIDCMEQYGGSFVQELAKCLIAADPNNYQKLRSAFPEYFLEYAKMAGGKKEDN